MSVKKPRMRSANAQKIAAGPSVIARNSRLGGYFVVLRKSISVFATVGCDCQWLGSP